MRAPLTETGARERPGLHHCGHHDGAAILRQDRIAGEACHHKHGIDGEDYPSDVEQRQVRVELSELSVNSLRTDRE